MSLYRKKSVVIEAMQFTGDNLGAIEMFIPVGRYHDDGTFSIVTLEGDMKCSIGDYVIKGVKGEFYPCKPDIFEATYDCINTESMVDDEDRNYECSENLLQQNRLPLLPSKEADREWTYTQHLHLLTHINQSVGIDVNDKITETLEELHKLIFKR